MLNEIRSEQRQKSDALNLILAGLEGRSALDYEGVLSLQKELSLLAQSRGESITSEEQLKAESIIAFIFRDSVGDCLDLWFGKSLHTDAEIWRRFGDDVLHASTGKYDHWALNTEHPRMFLALIILLDQFRRNMYRNTPEMYAADTHCLGLVKKAIRSGVIDKLKMIERVFPCLVLTHSEVLSDQQLCQEEWERVEQDLARTDPLRVFGEVFERHLSVIDSFGRFPHRNAILERASTPEEVEFLADVDFRFDLPLVRLPDGSFCFQGEINGHSVETVDGDAAELSFGHPDASLAKAETDIRLQGYANVENVRLKKYIVERNIPDIGSKAYRELKSDIDAANRAISMLWPKMAWVESFVCDDKTFCVYLADDASTLRTHALLSDMPLSSINEVCSIVDPSGFDRDLNFQEATLPASQSWAS